MVKKNKLIFIIGGAIIAISLILIAFLTITIIGGIDTRPNLVFSSESLSREYDGTPLTADGWEFVSGSLKSSYTPIVSISGTRTDAGVSENYFSVEILNEKGKNVSDSYNIKYLYGKLEVVPRHISIRSDSATKAYDGTPLTSENFELIGGEVLDEHILTVQILGTRTDAGISNNEFNVEIADSDGKSVLSNYEPFKIYGKLEVEKRKIGISTPSVHAVYDGNPISSNVWEYASLTEVLERHEIEVFVVGTQTDAGISLNSIGEVRIFDGSRIVTSNYDVEYFEGELIVTPRPISIRTDSAEQMYNGLPLTRNGDDNWKYASNILPLNSHKVKVMITGERISVGTSPNDFSVMITNEENEIVNFNYEIDCQEGALTVLPLEKEPNTSSGGNLDESGAIGGSFNDKPGNDIVARIYSTLDDQIYLRYMSFGDYRGSSWNQAPSYTGLIDNKYSLNYLTGISLQNAGYLNYPVTIEVLSDNYLLPYYLATDNYSYDIQTSDVKHYGSTSSPYYVYRYLFDYVKSSFSAIDLDQYNSIEQQYYYYVINNYLSLYNQETINYFSELITLNGFDKNKSSIIEDVAKYIQNTATYNLKYDHLMDSENNIAVSFLRDYKEGICSHFASAATLLYRALGIPARYVIGYVGNVLKNEWTEIDPSSAHAWVEVYIKGVGWVHVEVTGAGFALSGESGDTEVNQGESQGVLRIKPVDVYMKYQNGKVLTPTGEIQGLSNLLKKGFTYSATVSGQQSLIGISYSTIDSFVLYDNTKNDVTSKYQIYFGKGKLHVYALELTVSTEGLIKTYDGTLLASDKYTLDKNLIMGHVSKIIVLGKQTYVGESQNYCYIKFEDEYGMDVTYMYKVNAEYGVLEIEARKIVLQAGSITKRIDELNNEPLVCDEFEIVFGDGLAEGDAFLSVIVVGSQSAVGHSQNIIESVEIVDKNNKDVTSNYSIEYINGKLEVIR